MQVLYTKVVGAGTLYKVVGAGTLYTMFALVRYDYTATNLCRYDGMGWRKFAVDNHVYGHIHLGMNRIHTMSTSRRGTAIRSYAPSGEIRTYHYPAFCGACWVAEIRDNPCILTYKDLDGLRLHSMNGRTSAAFDYLFDDVVSTDTGKCYLVSTWSPDVQFSDNIEGLHVVDSRDYIDFVSGLCSVWTDGAVYTTVSLETVGRQRLAYFTRRDPRVCEIENLDVTCAGYDIFGRLPYGLLMGFRSNCRVYDVRNCGVYYLENFEANIMKFYAL